MWCKYFMEAQGYTIDNNLLYQDNKSTILLAKNGRMPAGKASRHIHHRYFLITNKIQKGDVTLLDLISDKEIHVVNMSACLAH